MWKRHKTEDYLESIEWEVQNAISLDAARWNRNENTNTGSTTQNDVVKPQAFIRKWCEKCNKPGHSTSEHKDNFRSSSQRSFQKRKEYV